MLEKLKSILADDTIFIALLLVLVGVASFGLGRHSVVGGDGRSAPSAPTQVIVQEPENTAQIIASEGPRVVASKSGTKYHLLSCPGASQMKDDNKIFFASIELAKAAGYEPAANCPELDQL